MDKREQEIKSKRHNKEGKRYSSKKDRKSLRKTKVSPPDTLLKKQRSRFNRWE